MGGGFKGVLMEGKGVCFGKGWEGLNNNFYRLIQIKTI